MQAAKLYNMLNPKHVKLDIAGRESYQLRNACTFVTHKVRPHTQAVRVIGYHRCCRYTITFINVY